MKTRFLFLVLVSGLVFTGNNAKADSDIVPIPQPADLQEEEIQSDPLVIEQDLPEVEVVNDTAADVEDTQVNERPTLEVDEVNEAQFRPERREGMQRPGRGPRGPRGEGDEEGRRGRPERADQGEERMGPPPFVREMMRERMGGRDQGNRVPGRSGNQFRGNRDSGDSERAGRGEGRRMGPPPFIQNRMQQRQGGERGEGVGRGRGEHNRGQSMRRGFQGRGFGPGAGMRGGAFKGRGMQNGMRQSSPGGAPEMVKSVLRKIAQLEREVRSLKAEISRLKSNDGDRGNRRGPGNRQGERGPRPDGRGR